MKDIKELIYAAVEENALKFQELVNNQLQVRAYDAIEALRPEIGASMFGESSHKKMDDDEDEEEMEDEDEDEDEDEMDDKKKSMKEALHPNQQKIDVVDDEKIDAKDFAKLRQMKKMEEEVNLQEITTKSGADVDRNLDDHDPDEHGDIPDRKPDHELETHGGLTLHVHHVKDSKGKTKHTIINHVNDPAGGGTFVVKGHAHPKHILSSYNRAEREDMDEEVEQIDEIGDTPAGRAALGKLASQRFGRARWAAGVHRATSRSDGGASPHSRLQDKDSEVGKKAADKAGIAHRDVPDHNYDFDKKGGVGTKVADPAYKLAARNKPKMEEVKQVNERSREDLISQIKGLKKPAIKHGFDWPSNDSTDKTSTKDLKSFHKSARSVIKQGLKKDKAVNEVAMPKNAADWQALITHQIQTTGHPVATDAQFRAQHGKDMSKPASLEPGEDKLQYATAQGGTVKQ